MTCRRSQVRVLYRPPKQEPLTLVRGFFVASSTNPRQSRTVQDSNRAAAHSAVSKATVRLCLARGSQRLGMSTKKDAARLIRVGSFCFGGRYRTRTAAEATAACGGNREPRLGPRSDFSKPCQGAAEKSANATRTGASRQIPSRFPTPRNVYRDDRRFVVGGTGREPERAKAGYHYGSGILPFAILNRVWYTRLSSTNLHLED